MSYMKRTTVFLPEEIDIDLKVLARQQHRPVADMVREALGEYVARAKEGQRRTLRFVAVGASGRSDTAERHEELLFDGLEPHGEDDGPRAARRKKQRRPSQRR